MLSTAKKVISFIAIITLIFTFTAVSSVDARKTVYVKSIKLIPKSKTIGVGEKITLKPTVSPKKHNENLKWSSSKKKVATVSNKGVVKGKKTGKTKVTVKSKNKKGTSTITVKAAPTSIKLNYTIYKMEVNDTFKLTSQVNQGSASSTRIFYSSNNSIASVNSDGTVTAKKVGTCSIVVKTYNDIRAACVLNISEDSEPLLKLVNDERAKENLKPLTSSPRLNQAAQERTKEITKSFSHTRPNGKLGYTILTDFDIDYSYAGENLAKGGLFRTPEAVMKAWMDSPGHKENILNPNYTKMGMGFVEHGYYWVQLFMKD